MVSNFSGEGGLVPSGGGLQFFRGRSPILRGGLPIFRGGMVSPIFRGGVSNRNAVKVRPVRILPGMHSCYSNISKYLYLIRLDFDLRFCFVDWMVF